jgi:hypothetical protein
MAHQTLISSAFPCACLVLVLESNFHVYACSVTKTLLFLKWHRSIIQCLCDYLQSNFNTTYNQYSFVHNIPSRKLTIIYIVQAPADPAHIVVNYDYLFVSRSHSLSLVFVTYEVSFLTSTLRSQNIGEP